MNTEEYLAKYTRDARGRRWPFLGLPRAAPAAGSRWPRITVVTPSYNQAPFLEETICSVTAQNYPNLEYIIMDGGSTDGSQEIIARHSPWLQFWTSGKDGGQSNAIHTGFQRATGEILCWLNSDDVLLPGALWRVAAYFVRHPDVDCAVGGVVWIDVDGHSLYDGWGVPLARLPAVNTFERLLHWGQYACPQMSTFWRSEAYRMVGGLDARMQYCLDRDLFVRLAAEKAFGRIPYFLSCYRYHVASKSATIQHVRSAEDHLIDRKYTQKVTGPLRRHVTKVYYSSDVFLRKWWVRSTYWAGRWRLPQGLRRPESDFSTGRDRSCRTQATRGESCDTSNSPCMSHIPPPCAYGGEPEGPGC